MTFAPDVYAAIRDGCIRSAAKIVPAAMDLLYPESVIDVGCGEGWFAREFANRGCRVWAIDREVEDGYRDGVEFARKTLDPPALELGDEKFDLAVCLEVAEHIPEASSDALVAALTSCAPIVLWSAAIPGQTGHGHVTNRWPAYWAARFAEHGYACSDTIRWMLWDDAEIEVWYRQNLLVFADSLAAHGRYLSFAKPVAVVHPEMWSWKL